MTIRMAGVAVVRDGRRLLADVDWVVGPGERWAVLGPNGSGKTTLLRLAGAQLHPSNGTVEVLGSRLGRVDVRALRARIGLVSGSVTRTLRAELPALDVVLTGKHAALETWWHVYDDADRAHAHGLLDRSGCATLAGTPFGVLSEGERQQVLIARALMARPELLLLDEPAAGLDLGARERLVATIGALAIDPHAPPLVLVTHHVEEIPAGITHVALLRAGRVVAQGPIASTLTAATVSDAFGVDVELLQSGDRWSARARLG